MRLMQRFLILLLAGGMLTAMASCEQVEKQYDKLTGDKKFELLPPESMLQRKCASLCPIKRDSCNNLCVGDHNSCRQELRIQAAGRFRQYVDEKMARGELVDKTENDFWNESTAAYCRNVPECQERCEVGLRVCHAECGGTVMKGDKCYANCKERKQLTPYDMYNEPDGWGVDSLL